MSEFTPVLEEIIDIPISDYINLSSHIEASTLSFLKFSPLHFKNLQDEKRFPSDDLIVSSGLPFAINNTDEYLSKFTMWKDANRPNKNKDYRDPANKEARNKFIVDNTERGITVLSKNQALKINTIKKVITREYKNLYKHLKLKNAVIEKTILWQNEFGIKCKNRVSFISHNLKYAFDIKIVESASKSAFTRLAGSHYYPMQAYAQKRAMEVAFNKSPVLMYLVIDTAEPYGVNVFLPDEEFLKQGEEDYKFFNTRLKFCMDNNRYPGYEFYASEFDEKSSIFIETLSLPKYPTAKSLKVNNSFKIEEEEVEKENE